MYDISVLQGATEKWANIKTTVINSNTVFSVTMCFIHSFIHSFGLFKDAR